MKLLTSKRSKQNKSSMQGQGEESFPNTEVMGAGVRADLSAKAEMSNVKTITVDNPFGTS